MKENRAPSVLQRPVVTIPGANACLCLDLLGHLSPLSGRLCGASRSLLANGLPYHSVLSSCQRNLTNLI